MDKKTQGALRRTGILAVLMIVVLAGGALSSGIINGSAVLVVQSDVPDASVFEATPVQAFQFFFWVFFVIGNVVVVGGILALVFWLLSRALTNARSAATPPHTTSEAAE